MYFDDNISNVDIGLDVLINMPCIVDFHVSHELVFAPYSKIYYLCSLLKSDFNKLPCCDIDVTLF